MSEALIDPRAPTGLWTDLYQLTMMQAYLAEGMTDRAIFELFFRRLQPERSYLLACGLDAALAFLETVRFDAEARRYLASLPQFHDWFVEHLAGFRFTGDVWAVPEGTVVFENEPVVQVHAPLPQAQLVETVLLNLIHMQTLLASKAARVVTAAAGRPVVDFGFRRALGPDAAMALARCGYIAGFKATSNVEAGRRWGIPVSGTMAHSFIEAFDDELDAFRAFGRLYPDTTLLIDTYDTPAGADKVIELARELGEQFRIGAVRLDSGDLASLAKQVRGKLDAAGLEQIRIFASGGLDEYTIDDLVRRGAPIDGFGVGTHIGVSEDRPYLDCAYKLMEYAGRPRMKLSVGKATLPGRKQVFRVFDGGCAARDVIGRHDEALEGRPLLARVMAAGRRLSSAPASLDAIRAHADEQLRSLPQRLHSLRPPDGPYPAEPSPALRAERDRLRRELGG